jgi:hypothetical protein
LPGLLCLSLLDVFDDSCYLLAQTCFLLSLFKLNFPI